MSWQNKRSKPSTTRKIGNNSLALEFTFCNFGCFWWHKMEIDTDKQEQQSWLFWNFNGYYDCILQYKCIDSYFVLDWCSISFNSIDIWKKYMQSEELIQSQMSSEKLLVFCQCFRCKKCHVQEKMIFLQNFAKFTSNRGKSWCLRLYQNVGLKTQESDNNTDKSENIWRLWQSTSYVTYIFVKV